MEKFYVWHKENKLDEWSYSTDIVGQSPHFYGWQYRPNSEYEELSFHHDMIDPMEWGSGWQKNFPDLSRMNKEKMIADVFSI